VPALQKILGTTAMPIQDLSTAFAAGASVLLVVETWKWWLRRSSTDQGSGPRTTAASC
jgi:hypothetical protein